MPSKAELLAKANLTDRQVKCLALYCYDHKSIVDIAEMLAISAPSVKTHLKRAREKLRKAKLPPARVLQREPGKIVTNMDMDRIAPDEIETLW